MWEHELGVWTRVACHCSVPFPRLPGENRHIKKNNKDKRKKSMRTRGSSDFFRTKKRRHKLARKEKQQRGRGGKRREFPFEWTHGAAVATSLFLFGVCTFTSACLVQPPSHLNSLTPAHSSAISSGLGSSLTTMLGLGLPP